MKVRLLLLGIVLLAFAFVFMASGSAPTAYAAAPTGPICSSALFQGGPDPQALSSKQFLPLLAAPCSPPVVREVPFQDAWANSPHNDWQSEAFRHWDAEGEIPTACAKCHSTLGYEDFLGSDGSAGGVVDHSAAIGTTVECTACHNDVTLTKTSVKFPSGITINDLGDESRCMECHQGRESKTSVDKAITDSGVANEDTVSTALGFKNIHYYAAAATQYGTLAKGGYEYDGKSYDTKFAHVEGYDTCISCHNMHTLELNYDQCADCHPGVEDAEDIAKIRMNGSLGDYDGDGNVTEGVSEEIVGLQAMLYNAIKQYGQQIGGKCIVYDAETYPYFLVDANCNGAKDPADTAGYNAFTARLLKATYNYQVAQKDGGKYAHGGKYIIQLLYDSIASLNEKISGPINLSTAWRIDPGHFAGSEEPFRHWDTEGEVPGTCTRCHTAEGVPFFLKEGVNISGEPSNGLMCSTCHKNLAPGWERYTVAEVTFPSGAKVSLPDGDSNLCLECHQGRESSVSVEAAIAGKDLDTPSASLRFKNVHYFSAGATLFGNDVKGIYQYTGKSYLGRNLHGPGIATFDSCTECHNTHELEVEYQACSTCHLGVNSLAKLKDIRGAFGGNSGSNVDYDGDGSKTEGIYGEIDTMAAKLYAAIQLYAKNVVGTPIVYSPSAYPYFFIDTNGNGVLDPSEAVSANGYNKFTPRLLRTTYNYQYVQKDPGQFAHNAKYVMQALYDNLEDLGQKVTVDMTGLVRP